PLPRAAEELTGSERGRSAPSDVEGGWVRSDGDGRSRSQQPGGSLGGDGLPAGEAGGVVAAEAGVLEEAEALDAGEGGAGDVGDEADGQAGDDGRVGHVVVDAVDPALALPRTVAPVGVAAVPGPARERVEAERLHLERELLAAALRKRERRARGHPGA